MGKNKNIYLRCWRCCRKHKGLMGIKVSIPTNIVFEDWGSAKVFYAELPMPLCKNCVESFGKWCREHEKVVQWRKMI